MYTGGDIVPALVQQLQAQHASPTRQFAVIDLVTDAIPQACPALATLHALARAIWNRLYRAPYGITEGHVGYSR